MAWMDPVSGIFNRLPLEPEFRLCLFGFEVGSSYTAQAGLELGILPPQTPEG